MNLPRGACRKTSYPRASSRRDRTPDTSSCGSTDQPINRSTAPTAHGSRVFLYITLFLTLGLFQAHGDTMAVVREQYERGEKAFRENRLDEAISAFREVLRLSPNFAEAHANLGAAYYSQGKFPEAAEAFRQALKHKPSLPNAAAFLGMSEAKAGNLEQALPILEKSFHNSPQGELARQAGLVLLQLYHTLGDLDQAVGVVRKLQQEYPSDPEILYSAYRIYSDLGSKAIAELVRAGSESARLHQVTAELLETQGDFPQAVEQYRKAIEKDPELPGIHRALGVAVLNASPDEAGRGEAQRQFEIELAANPVDFHSEYQLGEIYWARSEYDEALQRFQRAVDLNPNFSDALIALGKLWNVRNEPAKALTYLQKAAKIDPANEVVHYRLSQAYRKLGRNEQAEQSLTKFKELRSAAASIGTIYQQVQRKPVTSQTIDSK